LAAARSATPFASFPARIDVIASAAVRVMAPRMC
jgi:hypothetical protein